MASHRISLRAVRRRLTRALSLVGGLALAGCAAHTPAPQALSVNTDSLPVAPDSVARAELVDVKSLAPGIVVALRYATDSNFTGAPLPGYEANRALLRRDVAEALARVEKRAEAQGLALKIWDAYRPVRATQAMVDWTERTRRQNLLRDGYIAGRSRHNLGSTVDLTLVQRTSGMDLEMGTPFDTFSPSAHTANANGLAAWDRALLKRLMEAEGFSNYDQEWWHYTYPVANPLRFDLVIR